MSKLNNDVLYHIFQDLFYTNNTNSNNKRNHKNSLHSCLLVNRLWCEVMIPILWSYPYKYVRNPKSFYNIIISHLSDNTIKFLKDKDIIETNFQKQKLSFNYVRFCKYMDIMKYLFTEKLLREEIYKLLISECLSIKSLNNEMAYYPIIQYPGANISLSNLYELSCNTDDQNFYHELAKICRSIEKISVIIHKKKLSGIAELIEMQNQIKYILIMGHYECKKINQALEKHANSIIHLEITTYTSFIHFLIPKLINLQYLGIVDGKCELKKYVIYLNHYKLQALDLYDISSLDIAINIIKNANGNLCKIRIECVQYQYYHDKAKEYNQTIHKYCPNIKYVTLFLNEYGTLEELENIFIKCQHLEAIDIEDDIKHEHFDKFLNLCVELAPLTLYKIHIYNIYRIVGESLNLFLFNWSQHKGKKTLQLYSYNNIVSDIEHIVHKYNSEDFWNFYVTWHIKSGLFEPFD